MSKGKDFRGRASGASTTTGRCPTSRGPVSRAVSAADRNGGFGGPPFGGATRRRRQRRPRSTRWSNGSRPTRATALSSSPAARATPFCTPMRCTPRATKRSRRAPSYASMSAPAPRARRSRACSKSTPPGIVERPQRSFDGDGAARRPASRRARSVDRGRASAAGSSGSTTPRVSASSRATTAARTCSCTSPSSAPSGISRSRGRPAGQHARRRHAQGPRGDLAVDLMRACPRRPARRPSRSARAFFSGRLWPADQLRRHGLSALEHTDMQPSRDIRRLLEIMAALRTPGTGCPWDLEQNFATHRALHDRGGLRGRRRHRARRSGRSARRARRPAAAGRLSCAHGGGGGRVRFRRRRRGDHRKDDPPPSRMCSATPATCRRRRSRLCGGRSRRRRRRKRRGPRRRLGQRRGRGRRSAGVPVAMPALTRALKLQEKAGKVGFDWNDAGA